MIILGSKAEWAVPISHFLTRYPFPSGNSVSSILHIASNSSLMPFKVMRVVAVLLILARASNKCRRDLR